MDLSNLKTWTDGLWGIISAPHVVVPLLVVVAITAWCFEGHSKEPDEMGSSRLLTGGRHRLSA